MLINTGCIPVWFFGALNGFITIYPKYFVYHSGHRSIHSIDLLFNAYACRCTSNKTEKSPLWKTYGLPVQQFKEQKIALEKIYV